MKKSIDNQSVQVSILLHKWSQLKQRDEDKLDKIRGYVSIS